MTSRIPNELPPVPEQCLDTAIACDDCTMAANGLCGYLLRGQEAARNEAELEELSHDRLLENYLTDTGVKRQIERDPQLAQHFQDGTVGMIIVDLRGVKATNERISYAAGNRLIQAGAERLRSFRTHPEPVAPGQERRSQHSASNDIFMRAQGNKSDELVIIMPGVATQLELDEIVDSRTRPAFSIRRAVADSEAGDIPVVANVAGTHGSQVYRAQPATATFHDMIETTLEKLRKGHDAQYEAMWDCVQTARQRLQGHGVSLERPADERQIVDVFWEVCCPDFARNATTLLSPLPEG